MAFKTVLTAVTDPDLAERCVSQAARMASRDDGHLDVLCYGVDRAQAGFYDVTGGVAVLQQSLSDAAADAEALSASAKAALAKVTCRWTSEEGVAQLADIGRVMAQRARFADLVVLPHPYGTACGVELEPLLEGALFQAGAPVLVLPETGDIAPHPKRIVVGWNDSAEALSAMRAALPLLQGADVVHLVIIDPPRHGQDRSDPGGVAAQWLARHGVTTEIDVLARTMPRVADVLMRHTRDVGADLLVMGAYGHSRFREAILGGATRSMLEAPGAPIFMAH